MNCAEFDRWLDERMPESEAHAARAHAGGCEACGSAWRAMREVETALAPSPERAPADFARAVLTRIAREPRRAAPASLPDRPLPWWAAAALEPVTALAVASVGALCLGGDRLAPAIGARTLAGLSSLVGLAAQVGRSPALQNLLEDFSTAGGGAAQDPRTPLLLAAGLSPAILWASLELWRWASGLGVRRPR